MSERQFRIGFDLGSTTVKAVCRDSNSWRAITRAAAESRYRFSSFVLGVARSAPFQMKTKASDPPSAKTE